MLNQFNQFICIQIRNAGVIAIGCLIDGLVNMIDVLRGDTDLLRRDFSLGRLGRIRPSGQTIASTGELLQPQPWHRQFAYPHWPLQLR